MRVAVLTQHLGNDSSALSDVRFSHAGGYGHKAMRGGHGGGSGSGSGAKGSAAAAAKGLKVNMDIFKRGHHHQYPNKNVFDDKTFSWVPTFLTGKYRHRFVSTADLIDGPKINAMLDPKEPPAGDSAGSEHGL